jgi:predicted alpha/beta superfamily hydrolase
MVKHASLFLISLYILLQILSSCTTTPETLQLNIKVQLEEAIGNEEQIFVSGNHAYLGEWHPGQVALNKLNDTLWEGIFLFPKDTLLEYKFTKGDWNLEAVNDDGSVPPNNKVHLTKDTNLIYKLEKWKDQIEIGPGTITGDFEIIEEFQAKELKNRNLTIWFPPEYKTNLDKRFPVLYVHDGQNVFDKRRSGYNMEWELDETADSLIKNNIVEPFIMVAIDNDGPNRSSEYSDCELGTKYRNFLINEVKPFIDSNYRTIPARESTANLGSSMGGLVAFILAWENPEIFSQAACFSPAFLYKDFNYLNNVSDYIGAKKDIQLYIDNGGVGLEKELQPGIDKMLSLLDKKDYLYNWHLFGDAEHNEINWAKRTWIPLVQFYGIKDNE